MRDKLLPGVFILLTACGGGQDHRGPAWISDPGNGVVASCQTHINGRSAQQQCAMQRARAMLAAEQGVEVSQVSWMEEKANNHLSTVSMEQATSQRVNNRTVRARLVDTWHDTTSDEFYVLMETIR